MTQKKKNYRNFYLLLLTHNNSYDENGEQVNAYQKSVAKIIKNIIELSKY